MSNPEGGSTTLPPEHPMSGFPHDAGNTKSGEGREDDPSLVADLDALIADSKTYFEAEVRYQKSRAGFAANRLKWTMVYGAAAFGLLHLALIALTVGVVIALSPLVGPWLATAIVVALLLLGAAVFVQRLRKKLNDIRAMFEGEPS